MRLDIDFDKHKVSYIDQSFFLLPDYHYPCVWLEGHIGPGEDVFMVGRFVNQDGGATQPALRFGNISSMPAEMTIQKFRRKRPYYLIDMHSRLGYSGSPVFGVSHFRARLGGQRY